MTEQERNELIVGQRVIVGRELGYYVQPDSKGEYRIPGSDRAHRVNPEGGRGYIWIHRIADGYASAYDPRGVRLLPGGQL